MPAAQLARIAELDGFGAHVVKRMRNSGSHGGSAGRAQEAASAAASELKLIVSALRKRESQAQERLSAGGLLQQLAAAIIANADAGDVTPRSAARRCERCIEMLPTLKQCAKRLDGGGKGKDKGGRGKGARGRGAATKKSGGASASGRWWGVLHISMCIDVVRSQLRAALDVLLADADRVAAVQPDVALEAAERVARASRDAAKLEEWLHRSGIDWPTTVGMIAQRWSRWEAGEQQHWAVRIAEAVDGAPAASSTAAHGGSSVGAPILVSTNKAAGASSSTSSSSSSSSTPAVELHTSDAARRHGVLGDDAAGGPTSPWQAREVVARTITAKNEARVRLISKRAAIMQTFDDEEKRRKAKVCNC